MLRKKIKGGALYIALIISIVTGITLSMFILIGFYNQKQVLAHIGLNQLQNNLSSAFNSAQSEYFQEYENNRWMDIGTDADSIRVKRMQWGAYSLISTETKNSHHYLKLCGLYGTTTTNDTAIVVCDQSYPVSLTGKIKFNGNCYFPKAGYKPVFIEGQSFNTTTPIHLFLRQAPVSLPKVKDHFVAEIEKSLTKFNPNIDSLISEIPDVLSNGFSAKTAVFQSGNLHLQSVRLSGNIKMICQNSIVIENTNFLSNILVVGSKVRVKKGFIGTLNIIASDSIIIEEDCLLNYPSSLTILNNQPKYNGTKGILVANKSIVYGSLICINAKNTTEIYLSNTMIKLDADCEIHGLVYSEGYAHLQ